MPHHVIVGPDRARQLSVRTKIFDGHPFEFFELAVSSNELFDALNTPDLFNPSRLVAVDVLDASLLEQWVKDETDNIVVWQTEKLSPAQKKKLSGFCQIHDAALLKGKALLDYARAKARDLDVNISPSLLNELVSRAPDTADVDTALLKLSLAPVSRLTIRHLDLLVPRPSEESLPWEVTDALDRSDYAKALQAAAVASPLAVLGFMLSQTVNALIVSGSRSQDEAASRLSASPYAVKKALALSKSLKKPALQDRLELLLAADLQAKRDDPQRVLVSTLARLSL